MEGEGLKENPNWTSSQGWL